MNEGRFSIAHHILEEQTPRKIFRLTRLPPGSVVRFGHLRRTEPIRRAWGVERVTPSDRFRK